VRELEQVPWEADASASAYGVPIRVRSTEADSFEDLVRMLPPASRPSLTRNGARTYSLLDARTPVGPAGRHILYCDEVELVRSRSLWTILEHLEASARFHIAEMSVQRTFVHAAVVGYRGRAIVLPGKSDAGKTTLTAALVRAGARYLSDEYALVDDRGRIHPYPKPLSIARSGRRRPLRQAVEDIGGTQHLTPLPVGLVVATRYGARRWRPRQLSPGKAMLELLSHTVSAQRSPANAMRRLGLVAMQAPMLRGARGEADETAPLILERLAALLTGNRLPKRVL
jgi:hypothetical protein